VTGGVQGITVVAPLELTGAWRPAAPVRRFCHGLDQNEAGKVQFPT
jgi:hypothetical protein